MPFVSKNHPKQIFLNSNAPASSLAGRNQYVPSSTTTGRNGGKAAFVRAAGLGAV